MQVPKFGAMPKKLGAKNMQYLGGFYTTSDFDHEYLCNESRYPKPERHVIESDPNGLFRQTTFQPLGGAGSSNIYMH